MKLASAVVRKFVVVTVSYIQSLQLDNLQGIQPSEVHALRKRRGANRGELILLDLLNHAEQFVVSRAKAHDRGAGKGNAMFKRAYLSRLIAFNPA
jgi:hypothetical protein